MVIDTIFLCYAEESGMVSRSHGMQDYADTELHTFMNNTLQRERNYRRVAGSDGNEAMEMTNRGLPKVNA